MAYDLGLWSKQPVGEVMTRWKDLRAAEGCLGATALGHQVHGDRVVWHEFGVRLDACSTASTATPPTSPD